MKKMVKSLLLGTAAGFVAVAGAQAADMPVKAKPVQYVKICSLYGDGFYYIPGTDTCLKMGGYLRVQAEYNAGAGGVPIARAAGLQARYNRGRHQRHQLPHPRWRCRGTCASRPNTARCAPMPASASTSPPRPIPRPAPLFWDRAFIQFAGFTVGKTQSFFDLFTYGGGIQLPQRAHLG